MPEKPVLTGFSRATKPASTGPSQFSCGLQLPLLGVKNRTKPDLKTLNISIPVADKLVKELAGHCTTIQDTAIPASCIHL